MSQCRQTLIRLLGWLSLTGALTATLTHHTIRDTFRLTAVIDFGLPWLLRLCLVLLAILLLRPKRFLPYLFLTALALPSFWEGFQSYHRRPPAPTSAPIEVTLWNAGRRLWKMDKAWADLAHPQTQVITVIEAGSFPGDSWNRFTSTLPDFEWRTLEGGIIVGIRGNFLSQQALGDNGRFRCHRLKVRIQQREITLLAVDIPSQPWLLRTPYLDRIRSAAPDHSCLILGDFNTPPSARGFDAWRGPFLSANETAGSGFRETWPYMLPLLTLDQIWTTPDLHPELLETRGTLRSDHRQVRARFSLQ